jgi:hypothetical protein
MKKPIFVIAAVAAAVLIAPAGKNLLEVAAASSEGAVIVSSGSGNETPSGNENKEDKEDKNETGGTTGDNTPSGNNPGSTDNKDDDTNTPGSTDNKDDDTNTPGSTDNKDDTANNSGNGTSGQTTAEVVSSKLAAIKMDDYASADAAVDAIKAIPNLKTAMKDIAKGKDVIGQVASLETAYCQKFGITKTEPKVETAAKKALGGDVTVVGATFSGAKSLDVTALAKQPVVSEKIATKTVFVEMKLTDANGKDISEIKVPIAVTIPVPEGIDAKKAVILHVTDENKAPEVITPIVNGNTLTFTLTSFSPIGVGEKTETTSDDNNASSGSASVSAAYDDGELISLLQNAADGSVLTITKEDGINTLSNSFMRELLAKKTVSLSMTYVYNGVEYSILIPAGADIDLDIEWYGPLYLAQHFGNTTVANGQYTIVKGDTLSKIAVRNGLKLSALVELNKSLAAQKYIFPGQTVRLK